MNSDQRDDEQAEWYELYRFAASSFYLDPCTEEIRAGFHFSLGYFCDSSPVSGASFLSRSDFESSIMRHIAGGATLFGIEVPTYFGSKVTNFAIARKKCADWDDFDRFQTECLFDSGLHVGVAVMESEKRWVLIKDPDVVSFFTTGVREEENEF